MAKANLNLNFKLGYLYVVELAGISPPVYKVGKTDQPMRNRIRAASTFAPKGITTHRLQMFFDMDAAESRVHSRLRQWHRPPEIAGQATETFSASLETINLAIDEEVALQREFAKECDRAFDKLRTNGFLDENTNRVLDELLKAHVAPKVTLQGAIIRCLNSTSVETQLCLRLTEYGIGIDHRTRTAHVACTARLSKLCRGFAKKQNTVSALVGLTHFNSLGSPVFS